MTAACELCGQIISGREVVAMNGDPDVIELQNFDLLAAAVSVHLSQYHQKETGAEMMGVAQLAAKVYSMTWVTSGNPNFAALQKSWRTAIVTELGKEKCRHTVVPAAAPSGAGGGVNSPNGSESKEIKSERNSST